MLVVTAPGVAQRIATVPAPRRVELLVHVAGVGPALAGCSTESGAVDQRVSAHAVRTGAMQALVVDVAAQIRQHDGWGQDQHQDE